MVLRPVRMAKVGLVGLKDDEERVLTVLHDLRLAQIEPLSPATAAELGPERGPEELRQVGDETLRFRGLLSALPPVHGGPPRLFGSVAEILAATKTVTIDEEVGQLRREDDQLATEQKAAEATEKLLGQLSFYPDRLEFLNSKSFLTFYGEASSDDYAEFASAFPAGTDVHLLLGPPGDPVRFLVLIPPGGADTLSRLSQARGVRLTAVPQLEGTVPDELARVAATKAELARRRKEIADRLLAVSKESYALVSAIGEALEIENRKAEVVAKLGASRSAFALEAWVPERDVDRLQAILDRETRHRTFFYRVRTDEEPPTMMSNPRGVRRFEFFVRFYSLPQATEWDPTLVFSIVFPIFFGFMLGDWGYGLVILLISLWMIRGFPGARHLPKFGRNFVKMILSPKGMQNLAYALLPGCAIAIGWGLYSDSFFGYGLLHQLFGYVGPADTLTTSVPKYLLFAGYVGLGMVVLGFLMGALKEYFHHHPRGVVAKSGGVLFAFGIAFFGLAVIHKATSTAAHPIMFVWYALLAVGLVMLLAGEGLQMGMMGLIEVVSHILSYTRLVGILLASLILALVINTIGSGLVHSGTFLSGAIFTIIAGLAIILIGQSFNVIIGVFEPGIQGARLIFVEYFSKFYTGNGKVFRPFGSPRNRTLSPVSPEPLPAGGPIVQTP
ncbi:MAG TPA: V-type ATPase 116kDa subunit family protein [Thermoplasmata archaeon]|nr:V-type ATPase 116kDa subunit family protein [Thermoplasmata archaeon]